MSSPSLQNRCRLALNLSHIITLEAEVELLDPAPWHRPSQQSGSFPGWNTPSGPRSSKRGNASPIQGHCPQLPQDVAEVSTRTPP